MFIQQQNQNFNIMKKILILSVLLLPSILFCQQSKSKFDLFIEKISLRQSFQGVKEKEEAAYFNFVDPVNKESSYNYSFAIGYNLYPKLNIRPFYEHQKNSLIEKKQNTMLAGVDLQTSIIGENDEAKITPYIIFKTNFKNDKVKSTKGLQSSFFLSPSFNGKGGKFYPLPDAVNNFGWLSYYYNVYGGVEYEGRYTAKDATLEGNTWRWAMRITGKIYPLAKALKERVEIIPDFTYRRGFSNTTTAEATVNKLWKLGMNVVLLTKEQTKIIDLKFGVDYTQGVDPTKGFDNQQVWIYSIKIKI